MSIKLSKKNNGENKMKTRNEYQIVPQGKLYET